MSTKPTSSTTRRSSMSSTNKKSTKNPSEILIRNLELENESLREEIAALKSIFSMPVDENQRSKHFRYKIYSLEKQIAVLTRLLDAKREAVATCETILLELSSFFQDFKEKIRHKQSIDESLVESWIDRIESNRKKSFKSMRDHASLSDGDTLYAPNSSKFVREQPIHLLDICSGKIEHLNLKNIADLESSLCDLHADLRSFQNELRDQTNLSIFPTEQKSFVDRTKNLAKRVEQTSNELFYLSILVPTRNEKVSFSKENLNAEIIFQRINSKFRLSPNIKIFLQSLFDALISAFNHQVKLLQLETKINNKQLTFYRHTLTNIHCEHIRTMTEILARGQQSFNRQLQTTLYEPLTEIIKQFHRMNEEKTDDSLKSFIFTFKIHLDRFNEVAHDLYQQITDGSQSIEKTFFEINQQMWKEIEQQQIQLVHEIHSIKQGQHHDKNDSLEKMFELLNNC